MGEVRVIAPAKAQLREWWSSLREDGRGIVRFHIGRMLPLIDIRLRFGLFHALTHFWSPRTTTLIFGKHELTPTLEEYSVLLGKSLDSGLVSPPIGQDPVLVLSEYLCFNRDDIARVLKANRGSCPIPFLDLRFQQAPSTFEQAKIFMLLFFGSLIFPHKPNAINPLIASLAQQVYNEKSCVNTILAETFISLSKLSKSQDKTFRVSPEIFQVWFLSHFSKFGNLLEISDITEHEHPLLKFEHEQDRIPDHHYSRWLVLLTNPSPVTFLWRAPCFKVEEARIAGYYPVKVLCQYGMI